MAWVASEFTGRDVGCKARPVNIRHVQIDSDRRLESAKLCKSARL